MADTLLSFGKALLEALRPALAAAQEADDEAADAQDSGASAAPEISPPLPAVAAGSASTTADAECFDIVVPLEDIAEFDLRVSHPPRAGAKMPVGHDHEDN